MHLLDHLVSDPADGVFRDQRVVDTREAHADLAVGKALDIQRAPSRPPRQRQALLPGPGRTSSSAASCSADGSGPFSVTFSSVEAITAPFPLTPSSAIDAG